MDNNILRHHGILGMRWGVRRYQNKDGSLTTAGKKRYDDTDGNSSYEDRKQRAVKSGSAKDVLRYKGDLTRQEMESIAARIRWEQEMSKVASQEVSSGKAAVDKIFNSMGTMTDYANKSLKAWNTFANIYNGLNKQGITLPKISTDISKGSPGGRRT